MGRRVGKIKYILMMIVCMGVCNAAVNTAFAKSDIYTDPYVIEQANGAAPNVSVYVTGKNVDKAMVFNGSVKGNGEERKLTQTECVSFAQSQEGIRYIVLIDNSKSVDEKQFAEAKKQLQKLRKSMREQDAMTVYTVGAKGSNDNMVKVVDSQGKKEAATDSKKLAKIKRNKNKTVLYRSLNTVLGEFSNATPSVRTVVLLLTDGEDDSIGRNNSKEQTLKSVQDSHVPVYGMLFKNVSAKPDKKKMKATENMLSTGNGHGYCDKYEAGDLKKFVKNRFKTWNKTLKKDTYVLRMQADTNRTVEGATLSLTETNTAVDLERAFVYTQNTADTQAPVISDIKKKTAKSIIFKITDDSSAIVGADKAENYTVRTKKGGTNWKVEKVTYNQVSNEVTMDFAQKLYTDDYVLSCNNITDDTQEANAITEKYGFHFKGLDASKEKQKELIQKYWWILLIVIVLVVGIIVIIIIKKKPGKIVEVDAKDLVKADTKKIRLTITDRKGTVKDVEWNVEGSIFVGRSDICNIFFDDDRLSRQHFVIEVTKMACYIEDLETTNDTFVNGVKITARRMLLDGDVITAGREKFVFHTVNDAEDNL